MTTTVRKTVRARAGGTAPAARGKAAASKGRVSRPRAARPGVAGAAAAGAKASAAPGKAAATVARGPLPAKPAARVEASSPERSKSSAAVDVPKAPKAQKPEKPAKPAKVRVKPVRDSFTMPPADFALIDALKARALEGQRPAKKSELLRAGLHALSAMTQAQLVAALNGLAPIKTGRPKKGH